MIDELERAKHVAEPVAWMWQHGETGNCGFIEHCSPEDRAQWERMNKPRQIVSPLYAHPPTQAEPATQANASGGYVPPNQPTSDWNDVCQGAIADFAQIYGLLQDGEFDAASNYCKNAAESYEALKREPR